MSLRDDSDGFQLSAKSSRVVIRRVGIILNQDIHDSQRDIQQILTENPLNKMKAVENIHDRAVIQDGDDAKTRVDLWGYKVAAPNLNPPILGFYRYNEGCWSTPASLEDILPEVEYRNRITPCRPCSGHA